MPKDGAVPRPIAKCRKHYPIPIKRRLQQIGWLIEFAFGIEAICRSMADDSQDEDRSYGQKE